MGRFKDPIRQLFLALTVCTLQVRIITKMLWQKLRQFSLDTKPTFNPISVLFFAHPLFHAQTLSVYMYIGGHGGHEGLFLVISYRSRVFVHTDNSVHI